MNGTGYFSGSLNRLSHWDQKNFLVYAGIGILNHVVQELYKIQKNKIENSKKWCPQQESDLRRMD